MRTASRAEITVLVGELRLSTAPRPGLTEQDRVEQVRVYVQRLEGRSLEAIKAGIRSYTEANQWWPTLAELLAAVNTHEPPAPAPTPPRRPTHRAAEGGRVYYPVDPDVVFATEEGRDALKAGVGHELLRSLERGEPLSVQHLIRERRATAEEVARLPPGSPFAAEHRAAWAARQAQEVELAKRYLGGVAG